MDGAIGVDAGAAGVGVDAAAGVEVAAGVELDVAAPRESVR